MRICFVVDARSQIAFNWIKYFIDNKHDVYIISTHPCDVSVYNGTPVYVESLGLKKFSDTKNAYLSDNNDSISKKLISALKKQLLHYFRDYVDYIQKMMLAPASIIIKRKRISELIDKISPDIVHSMRIQFEGILAQNCCGRRPLVVTTWGNDLTLFADKYFIIGKLTEKVMRRADALHCDAKRDVRLSVEKGFDSSKPSVVLPGAGGINADIFYQGNADSNFRKRLGVNDGILVIIYARRYNPLYICMGEFFEALSIVSEENKNIIVLCPTLKDHPVITKWVTRFGLQDIVKLLPGFSQEEMAELFRIGDITVSPGIHDGTPNTLLEAMACGCFPVVGDIESLREWITDGVNGFLCNPRDPRSQADAIIRAIDDVKLRERAAQINRKIIEERAEYGSVMNKAEEFYKLVISRHKNNENGPHKIGEDI